MFFKIIARMTELYFYFCIFFGLSATAIICCKYFLIAWNKFFHPTKILCDYNKTMKIYEFIKEKSKFALLSEDIFLKALTYIDKENIREELLKQWERLKNAK